MWRREHNWIPGGHQLLRHGGQLWQYIFIVSRRKGILKQAMHHYESTIHAINLNQGAKQVLVYEPYTTQFDLKWVEPETLLHDSLLKKEDLQMMPFKKKRNKGTFWKSSNSMHHQSAEQMTNRWRCFQKNAPVFTNSVHRDSMKRVGVGPWFNHLSLVCYGMFNALMITETPGLD